jgi:3-deoxy-D-manno-octulosonate cytidylyltransferase
MNIKILDCTLRDGGYINDWQFTDKQIELTLSSLNKSKVEIVELGYLNQFGFENNSTLFNKIKHIDKYIKSDFSFQKVVMINFGDFEINKLPHQKDTQINGIRLAFHKKDLEQALELALEIKNKGFEIFFQPMITKNYSDLEFLLMLEKVNKLSPFAFYIVDSFGSMSLNEFTRLFTLSDNNLNKNISLGYHSHNNLQLAFSNAISLSNANTQRDIIIDSSIYGIGRGAGNLNTELIAQHLNSAKRKNYEIMPLFGVIDKFLNSLMKESPWGFSPAQFLSASFDCHPNYANYLINKNTKYITEINQIISQIPADKRNYFDKNYIENIYLESLNQNKENFSKDFLLDKSKKIILIASGSSIKNHINEIQTKANSEEYISISLNHNSIIKTDFYFFSNQKRYDEFSAKTDLEKIIISNNIIGNKFKFTINQKVVTNVALIMLDFLISNGVQKVELAGIDGYSFNKKDNYSYPEKMQVYDKEALKEENKILFDGFENIKEKIYIDFITPSIFDSRKKLKILGVIPARYKSSRFEGKPLALINGIPMLKRTYLQSIKSQLLDEVIVATEDQKIVNYCESENIPVILTSDKCLTGTDRVAEVSEKKYNFDLYVNIQGDEPVIDPENIDLVVNEYKKYGDKFVAYNLYKNTNFDEAKENTIIKVIVNQKDELMYMSRYSVPFNKSDLQTKYKKQVCVYGFTKKALQLFASQKSKTLNEQYEDIEILRFIDLGEKIKMVETDFDSIAVDIPSDIQKVESFLAKKSKNG